VRIEKETVRKMDANGIRRAWNGPGGYSQVLSVGVPLVMSMISNTVMQFTDRIFLANYSLDAIAASLPASITSFLFLSFFIGVADYVSVFVAQYMGAGKLERVGASLWQGIWFCVPAWIILAGLGFAGKSIFSLSGHPPEILAMEVTYFRILSIGSGFAVLSAVLACFYSGRGLTKSVMIVNIIGAVVNIPLDYMLIYGVGPFPEMGIAGAGLATVIGTAFISVMFGVLIFRRSNEECFHVLSAWRPDRRIFRRLMRFGLPGGVQFFVDMFAITFFVFIIGRLGKAELAATNIIISLDLVAFLPCVGFHIATSVLVGQSLGAGKPEHGARATGNAIRLSMLYMGGMSLLFLFAPHFLLELFRPLDMSDAEFIPVLEMGTIMLRFVAAYSLLDAMMLMYSGALKGAGDTRFVMWSIGACSLGIVVVPLYLAVEWFGSGYMVPWSLISLYVLVLALIFGWRFRQGKWRTMSVIEDDVWAEAAVIKP
jgi:MATE family multidrug resistance protein